MKCLVEQGLLRAVREYANFSAKDPISHLENAARAEQVAVQRRMV